MRLRDAIDKCVLHVRRNTWMQASDWINLIDSAIQEIQAQTHFNIEEAAIPLVPGQRVYDLTPYRIYRLIGGPVYERAQLVLVDRERIGSLLANPEQGAPRFVYQEQASAIGLYPVPSAAQDGTYMTVRGNAWPQRLTATTPLDTVLPFDEQAGDVIVYGALLLAERIDTDIQVSREVGQQYVNGLAAMRGRVASLTPGVKRVKRWV